MSILDKYFELDKKRQRILSKQEASIYSLMAVERQWKVYERAAKGCSWDRSDIYRQLLDKCWDTVFQNKIMEEEAGNICYENKPENVKVDIDEKSNDLFCFCSIFADTLEMLIDDLCEDGCTSGFTFYNFQFLDGFLDEHLAHGINRTEDREEIIQNHELIRLEIERQNRDFEMISCCDNFKVLKEWCLIECNENILADYWFN